MSTGSSEPGSRLNEVRPMQERRWWRCRFLGRRARRLNEVRSTKERRLQAEKLPPDKGLYRVLREVSLETRHWTIMFFRKVHTM